MGRPFFILRDNAGLQVVNIGYKFISLPLDLIPTKPYPVAVDPVQSDILDTVALVRTCEPSLRLGETLPISRNVDIAEDDIVDTSVQAILGKQTGSKDRSSYQDGMVRGTSRQEGSIHVVLIGV